QGAELYDPALGTFATAPNMTVTRYEHAAILLGNGKVLETGGVSNQTAAELFNEAGGGGGGNNGAVACVQNTDCANSFCVDGFCCNNLCGSACDACNVQGAQGTCIVVAQGSPGSPGCAPYVCDGAGATCPMSCNSDLNCAPGNYCK